MCEQKEEARIGNAILEGLHYVLRSPIVFWLTLLLLLFNFILPTADCLGAAGHQPLFLQL
ncbi:hypothetical protein KDI_51660 [Dictyobacter arantiisoli]|uniref:Uncharacterized protein n=1 Tax=Dictyobacter arantiisoli TaxID=2014874 RepID=A0A5A5TJZ0_9CHLR|nr:hypothetical protein KDI_51660 [Dictyobacter arantiisoli]